MIYTGLRKSPEEIVRLAIQEGVDLLGISILSGAHKSWFPSIIKLLKDHGKAHIRVIGGGIIPEKDIPKLEAMGVKKFFHPGTPLEEILKFIRKIV